MSVVEPVFAIQALTKEYDVLVYVAKKWYKANESYFAWCITLKSLPIIKKWHPKPLTRQCFGHKIKNSVN